MIAIEDNPRTDHGRKERIIQALCKLNGVEYITPGARVKLQSIPSKRELWTRAYRDLRFRRKHSANAYEAFEIANREQDAVRRLVRDVDAYSSVGIPAHAGRYPYRSMFFRAWYSLMVRDAVAKGAIC